MIDELDMELGLFVGHGLEHDGVDFGKKTFGCGSIGTRSFLFDLMELAD